MASGSPNSGEIFDLRRIRRLAELMNEHDLSEVDLQQADLRLRLRRGFPAAAGAAPVIHASTTAPAPAQPAALPAAPTDDAHLAAITSPMVGTFYAASSPDTPPYVKIGDHVGPETIVCIVEAMKVFNEIPAGASGRVIAVLAESGEPVEFGQPLFKIDTRG
jgi:acetyl-CoA carboxylase biotin carboxyl carrier protein